MDKYLTEKYNEAALVLPNAVRGRALFLADAEKAETEEFRLRCGRPPAAVIRGAEKPISDVPITPRDIEELIETASASSRHSVSESIRNGFVTARGGHRIGICGTAVVTEGEVTSLRSLSSACVRIAREIVGAGNEVAGRICGADGVPCSALIISPPGAGKTTLLRDLVRIFSGRGARTALIDERGELAAVTKGVPQFDVGGCTDVMELAPRDRAVRFMVRAMSPHLVAVDEICSEEDAAAVLEASASGCVVLATAHASDMHDLERRGALHGLIRSGAFTYCITIRRTDSGREYEVGEFK